MVTIIRTKCCHLPLIRASNEQAVIYFDCSWSRKKMLSDNVELLDLLDDNELSSVYHIADEFCEEVRHTGAHIRIMLSLELLRT
jgi:hypothetical protein